MPEQDQYWMERALDAARRARDAGEVPIGAVAVYENRCVGEGWNQPISAHDPSAHAEIMALRAAAQTLGNYRLPGVTLYATLEPCVMCAGALIHARIARLVFGAQDFKAGAAGSVFNILADPRHNHCVAYRGGLCGEACAALLKDFFAQRRLARKA
jgi:tRNA(adenine34) deaminase